LSSEGSRLVPAAVDSFSLTLRSAETGTGKGIRHFERSIVGADSLVAIPCRFMQIDFPDTCFVKKQQMQWTLKGPHLLLQARTKVLNNELEDVFRRWYPQFRIEEKAAA